MPTPVTYTFADGPGNTASGAQVTQNFTDAMAAVDNVAAAKGVPVPVTAAKMRGKSIIGTAGTRTNVAFGALSDGPDQVSGIVLPADGVIVVLFEATWQSTVSAAAAAAIFIGANQAKIAAAGQAAPVVHEQPGPSGFTNSDSPLATYSGGLNAVDSGSYSGDVTTGQIVGIQGAAHAGASRGGPCYIFAAAGTYAVSVQFKASSGTVTVKNRKLWVWAESFG